MKINLEPNIGMANFILGQNIENYTTMYNFNFIRGDTNDNWDEYNFFDELLEVYVDKKTKLIESIASRFNCIYKGINLINLDFDNFLNIIKKKVGDLEKDEIWVGEMNCKMFMRYPIWVYKFGLIVKIKL